jgi:hypothetical protein
MTAADARDRILTAAGLHPQRHLSIGAQAAVDWLAGQDKAIVDGIVELVCMARALAPEAVPAPARVRGQLPKPRRTPIDRTGNSGP